MSNTFNYNETINRFKATDCGRYGKAFEINVKHFLNGNRGNSDVVSAKGKTDVKYRGMTFEIKSNCGEIAKIEKNHFVIYTMDNKNDFDRPENARVIPSVEFVQIINHIGLFRTKKTTNGYMTYAIQTYNNSKRKTKALTEALAKYPTLKTWVESL